MTLPSILILNVIGSAVGTLVLPLIFLIFKSYFFGYLAKKAENLATKEDIQKITRLQEEVRIEFEHLLEEQRTQGRLRLAVLERRFQAHQEAFTLWFRLLHSVHTSENSKAVQECQRWWEENNLYLDSEPRAAFKQAYAAAFNHPMLLEGPRSNATSEQITANWDVIVRAGPIIENAVSLPSIATRDISKHGEHEPTALRGSE